MTTKYQRYGLPVEPADPNAEYLTVQETAWVFKCSVPTIRRRCKELGLGATIGARILLDRDERRAMFDHGRRSPAQRIPAQRRRKSPAKRAAAPKASTPRIAA